MGQHGAACSSLQGRPGVCQLAPCHLRAQVTLKRVAEPVVQALGQPSLGMNAFSNVCHFVSGRESTGPGILCSDAGLVKALPCYLSYFLPLFF